MRAGYTGLMDALDFNFVHSLSLFAATSKGSEDSVGTLAAQRKQGLGAAITAYAVSEARRLGFSRICLQATEAGAPVYRRLGFREAASYARFRSRLKACKASRRSPRQSVP